MMLFFQPGLGWSVLGVVGPEPRLLWIDLEALDHRAGDRTAAGLICRHWRCSPLQKQERKRADRGFAHGRSNA